MTVEDVEKFLFELRSIQKQLTIALWWLSVKDQYMNASQNPHHCESVCNRGRKEGDRNNNTKTSTTTDKSTPLERYRQVDLIFDGKGDVKRFLDLLTIRAKGLTNDREQILYAVSCLQGDALKWWIEIRDQCFHNLRFEEWKSILEAACRMDSQTNDAESYNNC
jgi:hypothetical protein